MVAEIGLPIYIGEFDVNLQSPVNWGPSAYFQAQFGPDKAMFIKQPGQKQADASIGSGFGMIVPLVMDKRLILVGNQDVLVITLSQVMRNLMK